MAFTKATKEQAKLRIALGGVAGAGKTFTALRLASRLGKKIAVIDSEHASSAKYSDKFSFDIETPPDYSIDRYMQLLKDAASAGYEVVVIDSMSHTWMGAGGALDEVDKHTAASRSQNKFTEGWRVVSPKQSRFADAIIAYPGHVIATFREKQEYVMGTDGKKIPQKIGMGFVGKADAEYDYDVVVEISGGILHVTKTRCSDIFDAAFRYEETDKLADILSTWLAAGVEPKAKTQPVSEAEAITILIGESGTRQDLEKLTERIMKLPAQEKDSIRPKWTARLKEVSSAS